MTSNSEKSSSGDKLKDARPPRILRMPKLSPNPKTTPTTTSGRTSTTPPMLSGKAVFSSMPTTNLEPFVDPEAARLAKLSDKQLLGEARKMLARKPGPGQPELKKIDAAELICMIVMQFRAPLPGLDPYCLEKGAPKTYTMFREKEAKKK